MAVSRYNDDHAAGSAQLVALDQHAGQDRVVSDGAKLLDRAALVAQVLVDPRAPCAGRDVGVGLVQVGPDLDPADSGLLEDGVDLAAQVAMWRSVQ
jgi:hypothetical protein